MAVRVQVPPSAPNLNAKSEKALLGLFIDPANRVCEPKKGSEMLSSSFSKQT